KFPENIRSDLLIRKFHKTLLLCSFHALKSAGQTVSPFIFVDRKNRRSEQDITVYPEASSMKTLIPTIIAIVTYLLFYFPVGAIPIQPPNALSARVPLPSADITSHDHLSQYPEISPRDDPEDAPNRVLLVTKPQWLTGNKINEETTPLTLQAKLAQANKRVNILRKQVTFWEDRVKQYTRELEEAHTARPSGSTRGHDPLSFSG
ncbi:hypothetical protein H0H93_010599, partial [Arthromyces matolae]